jgi:DNA-binding beta-propeller fold protein YncE
MRSLASSLLVVTFSVLLADAASAQSRLAERAWPEPPAPARIRFVRSLIPDTRAQRSFLRKLWDVVTGGSEQPVMKQPYGVTVGPLGRLYVADTSGRALHVFDLRTGRHSKLDVDGESLIGVAALGDRLFVTDSAAGRVICLDLRGRMQWMVGREIGLERPTGIVAAGDRVHVVDTIGHRVVTLGPTGRLLGEFGSRGGEPGQFNFPTNIARDAAGRLYVTDSMNFRVQTFTPQGRYVSSFGKLGDGSGDLSRPKGIALDSDGHVYVVEGFHDVVQIFDSDGRFLLAFGEPGQGAGELWLATGIAIHDDRIYVADSSNQRVQVFEYLKEGR